MNAPREAHAGGWYGRLAIDYRVDADGRCTALDRHHGPLRVLQRLYPEGPAVCHHVLVHPPGGIVGGDVLEMALDLQPGSHALVTTPGATRFYRSAGAWAEQSLVARLAAGTRLEWLPLETLAFRHCRARNRLRFELAPGAETLGWDVLALGLPAAGEPFDAGEFEQQVELAADGHTVWLERGRLAGSDRRLLESPLGCDGRPVLATMWFAAGEPLAPARRDELLDAARTLCADDPLASHAGSSSPQPQLVVLRVLAPAVEPALALLTRVRAQWRRIAWGLDAQPPRIWRL